MFMKINAFLILICIAAGITVSADQIHSKPESDAYPKGYYNGDSLPEKTVYLTFDDGPSDWTEGVLDILKQENVKATFFVSAWWNNRKMTGRNSFQKHKNALVRIVNEGHILANHTSGHRVLTKLHSDVIKVEFRNNQTMLDEVLGKDAPRMTIIRLPLGRPWSNMSSINKKKYMGSIVRDIGIVAMWTKEVDSTDSWDWARGEWYRSGSKVNEKNPSFLRKRERIYNRIISNADGRGMVVLMHDTHLVTRDVLSSVIIELKKRGYGFCTMEDFVQWKYGKSSRELLGM